MANFTVTNTNDTGVGSLRAALVLADASAGADTIMFDAGLAGSTINLQSVLEITQGIVEIDGDIDGDGDFDITISGDSNLNGLHDAGDTSLLNVLLGSTVMLNGLEFTSGYNKAPTHAYTGIAGITNNGALSVLNSVISNNMAIGSPNSTYSFAPPSGAIAGIANIGSAAILSVSNTLFSNNNAVGGDSDRAPEPIGSEGYDGYSGGNAVAGIFNSGIADVTNVSFAGGFASGGDGGRASDGYCYRFAYNCPGGDGGNGGNGGAASTGIFNTSSGFLSGNAISIGGLVAGGTGNTAGVGVDGFGSGAGFIGSDGTPGVNGIADIILVNQGGNASGFAGVNGNLIEGTAGNNVLIGTEFADTITGLAGDDVLQGGAGDDVLDGGANGTAGDVADYSDAASGIRVFLTDTDGQNTLGSGFDTHIGIENLTGSDFDDNLYGDAGNNVLRGGLGNDRLVGDDGNDTLWGGAGDDILKGGLGLDTLFGQAGSDTMFADEGVDILYGGADNDFLYGGREDDILNGDGGDDRLRGNLNNDILNGGAGADLLFGGGQQDQLNGGAGNDNLNGDNHEDILDGGAGDDVVRGGALADIFVFKAGNEIDRIRDWEDGIDKIDLSSYNFADAATALSHFVQAGANVRFFENPTTPDILIVEGEILANITAADLII